MKIKKSLFFVFLFICIALSSWVFFQLEKAKEVQNLTDLSYAENVDNPRCIISFSNGKKLTDVRLANTRARQLKGLSHTRKIDGGMLFTFDEKGYLVFWMKDTPVSLSVGFFDENSELFQIDDMQANSTDLHYSNRIASQALELEHGGFEKAGLRVGERMVRKICEFKD